MLKITALSLMLLSTSSFATCFMTRTVCTPNNNFQNSYELNKVTCSPPGGPATTTKTFSIFNKLAHKKRTLFSKNLNFTRDNYLQVELKNIAKAAFLLIDDRSLTTATNVNISTPQSTYVELVGYKCKNLFR